MAQDLVSVAEAAELAGCSRMTICRKIRDGDLPATRLGERVWLIDRAAVLDLAPTLCSRTLRHRAEAAARARRTRKPARRR